MAITYTWTINNVETLSEIFPGKFEERIWGDDGVVNFCMENGELIGGDLKPYCTENNSWKMKYDWHKQKLFINFYVYQDVCVQKNDFENLLSSRKLYKYMNECYM